MDWSVYALGGRLAEVDTLADNYSILLAYFTRQNGVDVQEIRRFLEIGEDYEDIY